MTPKNAVPFGQTQTPGPWFWTEDTSGRSTSLRRSGSGDVVVAPDNTPGEYAWLDVSEADASLIAAAPELLEALTALVNAVFNMEGEADAMNDARAAIAKAHGK